MSVLTDLKNRGIRDVFFVVCDGLKGLPDSVNAVFPLALVQACIIHPIRGTFRYASKRYWEALAKDLKPIYTAVNDAAAEEALAYLEEKWASSTRRSRGCGAPAGNSSSRSWTTRRGDPTSPVLDQRDRVPQRALPASRDNQGTLSPEQAALKTLYLVTRSMDPKGTGQARWVTRWKPALNAFAATFADRMPAAESL
jgi:transposase-like protein